MADAVKYPSNAVLTVFQYSRPLAPNPRIAQPVDSTATTITVTNPPLDNNGNVLTSGFLMNAQGANGAVEIIGVPPGAVSVDGLTFTGVVRGIRPYGLDYTTGDPAFAIDLPQDAPIGCAVAQTYHRMMIGAQQGIIASGAPNWRIGDGIDENVTVYAYNGDLNQPFFRYDAATSQWVYSDDGVSSTNFGNGAGVTGGDGIDVTAGVISVDTSETTVFVNTSAGAADANKVPILDANGLLAGSFIPNFINVYTANDTWTKPAGAKIVEVICIGAGGSGGGGSGAAAGTSRIGGSGGGGGAINRRIFRASDLTNSVAITVAVAPTGGTGGTSGAGGTGTAGGNSTFGAYLTGFGGGRGSAGTTATAASGGGGGGSAGVGGNGSATTVTGGLPASTANADGIAGQGAGSTVSAAGKVAEWGGGGGGGVAGTASAGAAGGGSIFAGGGGGAGGSVEAASPGTVFAAGTGGAFGSYAAGSGAAAGVAGSAGDGAMILGGGGGGGVAVNNATGNAGGAGGTPGGGGGGGGAGTPTGGAGGAGGRGQVTVITYS